VTMLMTESRFGFGSAEIRAGCERRSWESLVVGRALSVEI
jgi:hypothetical protein